MAAKTQRFKVSQQERGLTLDRFLAARLETSRKQAKALLDGRHVFVNGRRVWMAGHPVAPGMSVEVLLPEKPQTRRPLALLYEDASLVVADKPAGLDWDGDDGLEARLRQILDNPALSAVHRLDRDTSGCLMLARTEEAREALEQIFKQRKVKKTYHVIVGGRPDPAEQTIRTPIDGVRAVTHLTTLDANRAAAHLLVKIETGRTHQIRRHLASIRLPVLGDRHYGDKSRRDERDLKIGRQMLHAASLSFSNPLTGASVRAESPLPRDFRNCLALFRLT